MAIDDLVGIVGGLVTAAVAITGSCLAIWTAVTNRRDRHAEDAKPRPMDPALAAATDALAQARRSRDWWQDQALTERARADALDRRLDTANLALAGLGEDTY